MFKFSKKHKSKLRLFIKGSAGFAIVELVVAVAIIVVFFVIVISNFPQIRLQFSLSRVSYKFAQDVRRAQDMALSSVEHKDSNGNVQSVDGYGVYIDLRNFIGSLGNKKYIIYADASPGNQQYDTLTDYIAETIDFSATEPEIIIKKLNNVLRNKVSINFNSSNITTSITTLGRNQSSVGVIFSFESDVTKIKTVSINTSGLVEVK